jgi:hypothetical protein
VIVTFFVGALSSDLVFAVDGGGFAIQATTNFGPDIFYFWPTSTNGYIGTGVTLTDGVAGGHGNFYLITTQQLYSGSETAPTFVPGSYVAQDYLHSGDPALISINSNCDVRSLLFPGSQHIPVRE